MSSTSPTTDCDVSVIIATFRREKILLEAIHSALAQQEGVAVEVLVMDDTGPEATARAAVEGLGDPRVRYVARAKPSGGHPGMVRNEGAKIARGRFLNFCDDDDRLEPGGLRALAAPLQRDPSIAMTFGNVVPFGDDADIVAKEAAYFVRASAIARSLKGDRRRFAAQLLFADTCVVNCACMIRRETFLELGGFDETLRVCEDVELYLRAGRTHGFEHVDQTVLHYRKGTPSITRDLGANGENAEEKVRVTYRVMYERYKKAHGALEFNALKLLVRARKMLG